MQPQEALSGLDPLLRAGNPGEAHLGLRQRAAAIMEGACWLFVACSRGLLLSCPRACMCLFASCERASVHA